MSGPAPGAPGIPPTWSSSAKELVGCSLGASRVWFTLGGGIVNEIYHPRVDIPQIRDLGFIVADGKGFWVEIKRLEQHTLESPAEGVPAVTVVHRHERFELSLRIVPCIHRDALLIDTRLASAQDLHLYVLLAPHLGGTGHGNLAGVLEVRGRHALAAVQGPFALALMAVDAQQRDAFSRASAGYVGVSDGWQDFEHHGAMTWEYGEAGPGNVALLGELPRHATLALAFASSRHSAATLGLTALLEPFEHTWRRQIHEWQDWHARNQRRAACWPQQLPPELARQLHLSAMVLRSHQDKIYPGTMVASLSVPWGNTRDEIGGYHLVWPRDLVQSAGALLALGAVAEARNTLRYLIATQQADGHWNQNQWLGGTSYWTGQQLDETALPVLLAIALEERGALEGIETGDMIARALGYLVRQGPATQQDRWEEQPGLNPYTLAVCIAALVCGAQQLESRDRELALAFADYWNARLDDWLVARDGPLCQAHDVAGFYVRIAPGSILEDRGALANVLPGRNLAQDPRRAAREVVGIDFLQLVRFGLRAPDDPLILGTLRVVDALLRIELPTGPCWYRYRDDGYGEHEDGSAYDGTGRGRPWPLLTGERGHYELAAGRDPLQYLSAMAAMASPGGMLPEQVWDSPDDPARGLIKGRATGSAMPLAWAHAEFVKLAVSRELHRAVDRPAAVWERYAGQRPALRRALWTPAARIRSMPAGLPLAIVLPGPAEVIWSCDAWRSSQTGRTAGGGLGLQLLELDAQVLPAAGRIEFTWRTLSGGAWAGENFAISIGP